MGVIGGMAGNEYNLQSVDFSADILYIKQGGVKVNCR